MKRMIFLLCAGVAMLIGRNGLIANELVCNQPHMQLLELKETQKNLKRECKKVFAGVETMENTRVAAKVVRGVGVGVGALGTVGLGLQFANPFGLLMYGFAHDSAGFGNKFDVFWKSWGIGTLIALAAAGISHVYLKLNDETKVNDLQVACREDKDLVSHIDSYKEQRKVLDHIDVKSLDKDDQILYAQVKAKDKMLRGDSNLLPLVCNQTVSLKGLLE